MKTRLFLLTISLLLSLCSFAQSEITIAPLPTEQQNIKYTLPKKTEINYASLTFAAKPIIETGGYMYGFTRHRLRDSWGYYYSLTTSIPFIPKFPYIQDYSLNDYIQKELIHTTQLSAGTTLRLAKPLYLTFGAGIGTNITSFLSTALFPSKYDIYVSPELGFLFNFKYITIFGSYRYAYPFFKTTDFTYNKYTNFTAGIGLSPDLLTVTGSEKNRPDRFIVEFGQKVYNLQKMNSVANNVELHCSFAGPWIKLNVGSKYAFTPTFYDWTIACVGADLFINKFVICGLYLNMFDIINESRKGPFFAGGAGFKLSTMFNFFSISPYIEYTIPYGNYSLDPTLLALSKEYTGIAIGLNISMSLGF